MSLDVSPPQRVSSAAVPVDAPRRQPPPPAVPRPPTVVGPAPAPVAGDRSMSLSAPALARYVLMERYLVAADSLDDPHLKWQPNPVQLSLGLLAGGLAGAVLPDVDGDGIKVDPPPSRLDLRA